MFLNLSDIDKSRKMNSIGTFLKETRENLALQLQDVQTQTEIDLTVLSRIENGKRMPTKPQLLQLAQLYKCDQHKVLVHWLSDKVVSEIKYEEFGIEALQVAEEKVLYGKSVSLFPELKADNAIQLESRRYIGSKAKLTNWIIDTIQNETQDVNSLLPSHFCFEFWSCGTSWVFGPGDSAFLNSIIPRPTHYAA